MNRRLLLKMGSAALAGAGTPYRLFAAPVGGTLLIVSWLVLAVAAVLAALKSTFIPAAVARPCASFR